MNFPIDNIIQAPSDPTQWDEWRKFLDEWRTETKASLNYDGALYGRPDFTWVAGCYSCYFLMLCDETFYKSADGRYMTEEFLDVGEREFGGYDAIVLWHAYPRIGFDDRNQYDMYRDMPGGLSGLRDLSRALRARGVKVFIDYTPWDTGTRREDKSDREMLAEMVREIEADGIFLDTMTGGGDAFRSMVDLARPGVVFEPEGMTPLENLADQQMSWGQWLADSDAPGVLRNKWLERRHMIHQTMRWHRDHTTEIQSAWMNGSGMMVWENIFGSWVGMNERDKSLLRSMLPILRRYVDHFISERWTPLVPTQGDGIFASLWELGTSQIWTLINRTDSAYTGPLITLPYAPDRRYFDLISGSEAEAWIFGGCAQIDGTISPRGIGALLAIDKSNVDSDFLAFLDAQRDIQTRASADTTFPALTVQCRQITPTQRVPTNALPADMLTVNGGTVTLQVAFRQRECDTYGNTAVIDAQYPPLHTPLVHERTVTLGDFAIDSAPITNKEYRHFLEDSGYTPRFSENFLKHWTDGMPSAGEDDHPVVYIDLDDARAYAQWAEKRLPTELEWQHAIQIYPQDAEPIRVWNWTESERSDGRTRFCILKGGCDYEAIGSHWYADGGPQPPEFSAKFLMMWPGLDRCATIGFRCVVDLATD